MLHMKLYAAIWVDTDEYVYSCDDWVCTMDGMRIRVNGGEPILPEKYAAQIGLHI